MAEDSGTSGMIGVLVGVLLVLGVGFFVVQAMQGGGLFSATKNVNVDVKLPGTN
jgi:hypothetical protein